jgi:hypothetical protein
MQRSNHRAVRKGDFTFSKRLDRDIVAKLGAELL